jgi:hypothetical protein
MNFKLTIFIQIYHPWSSYVIFTRDLARVGHSTKLWKWPQNYLWLKKKVKFVTFLITVANENFNLAGALLHMFTSAVKLVIKGRVVCGFCLRFMHLRHLGWDRGGRFLVPGFQLSGWSENHWA